MSYFIPYKAATALTTIALVSVFALRASEPALGERAEKYMQARVKFSRFSGSVLVARAGKPVFRGGYGLASRELAVKNAPEMKYLIGSVSKQFTAAAVMLLQQRGRLSVTDPVSKYIVDWPSRWSAVTVHHLLTHTAGLPRISTPIFRAPGSAVTSPHIRRSFFEIVSPADTAQALDNAPGERFSYSNYGYMLLGLVIERASGKPYADFLQEDVFAPLGMHATGYAEPRLILDGRAAGYARSGDSLTNSIYTDVLGPYAAGALYSSVDDLLRWNNALETGLLLKSDAVQKLFTPARIDNPYGWTYAYGWWSERIFERQTQWHRGNIPGFVGVVVRFPSESLFVAVLSNEDRTQVRAIANELAAIFLGAPYEVPHTRSSFVASPAALQNCAGTYHRTAWPTDSILVKASGPGLVVTIPGPPPFAVVAESDRDFYSPNAELGLECPRSPVGELKLRIEGEQSAWVKKR